jgi:prepilin-type N-terminal cleavage/methylation domain-containing protein
MFKRRTSDDSGLTLIEMMVTLVLVGIVASIAVPVYFNTRQEANKTVAVADGSSLQQSVTSLLAYNYDDYGTAPDNAQTAITLDNGTLLVSLNNPTPSDSLYQSAPVRTSAGTYIVNSGISGRQFCFTVYNSGQNVIFNQDGYKKGSTTCNSDGSVG